ncbi:TetR/AcrR family transcriptional regulator [Aminobacter sp. NyZ550]|uniref:TetR/AcrR family transcriptional regulator n=1 Tax=Aminobacter sp. NyZ550 TaxID=2979870 RepID=UPI0021D60C9A|nr:TetR/AcrR family transcriptional regulator [Aminobacter sp. NyZ550]WAX92861.1 TetR/AcrR family transcriptional regulator [Aminobacter sp. NyZ550]
MAGNDLSPKGGIKDLTRDDWLRAAVAALAEGGVEAVKVERLAKSLGVSKGSFYWHFKDRPQLLAAILDFWDADFTQQLINDAAALATPKERLRHLAQDALERTVYGIDSARAEAAIQSWAATDTQVAERLRAVDTARLAYLERELATAGLEPDKARARAKMLYLALLGLYAARGYNPELADDSTYLALVELALQ